MTSPAGKDTASKPTPADIANAIADEYPDIFENKDERELFKADFKLLVRTYAMEGNVLDVVCIARHHSIA